MPKPPVTPEDEPPTDEQWQKAVYEFVGYRRGRALRVTGEALLDGLHRGCLRWYYAFEPSEFAQQGTKRTPVSYNRVLVIERQYTPIEQGITTVWNEWCVRWGLQAMQVFTPQQRRAREEQGQPVVFADPPDPVNHPRLVTVEPKHVPGAVGDGEPAEEVERAIVAAAAEYDLDLGEPEADAPRSIGSIGCESCSAGPGEVCDAECQCTECQKVRSLEAATALLRSAAAPQKADIVSPRREKKFWED